jgi:hypothetical protein
MHTVEFSTSAVEQSPQVDALTDGLYVPTEHAMHTLLLLEYDPAGHCTHAVFPADEVYDPSGHVAHVVEAATCV